MIEAVLEQWIASQTGSIEPHQRTFYTSVSLSAQQKEHSSFTVIFHLQHSDSASAASTTMSANDAEKNIEMWKVKTLIKRLEAARGNGTSMISLIIRESLSK